MNPIPEIVAEPIPELDSYPEWICLSCGLKYAVHAPLTLKCDSHHPCGICGKEGATARHTYFGDLKLKVKHNG
jgi:hypothetical protein